MRRRCDNGAMIHAIQSVAVLAVLVGLVTGPAVDAQQYRAIDSIDYDSDEAVSEVWQAGPALDGPTLIQDRDRAMMRCQLPFGDETPPPRVTLDRNLELDLSGAGWFEFALEIDDPKAVAHVTLYFRSGSGWYACAARPSDNDRSVLTFSRSDYGVEGEPAGWDRIDGMRIAVWRSSAASADTEMRVGPIRAGRNESVILVPGRDRSDLQEYRSMLNTADDMQEMLDAIGIPTDRLSDTDLTEGSALDGRRLVVIPYHTSLTGGSVDALCSYVQNGGKLFIAYTLPEKLGDAIGVGSAQYVKPNETHRLAEIRFTDGSVNTDSSKGASLYGLPDSMRQSSWNITVAEPEAYNARTVGYWYDIEGRVTGYPAMIVSDRGAFFSHVVMTDDPDGKRQMMAAVVGQLCPELWPKMAQNMMRGLDDIGHFDDVNVLVRYFDQQLPIRITQLQGEPGNEQTILDLKNAVVEANRAIAEIDRHWQAGQYGAIIEQAGNSRQQLINAYLRLQEPVEGEFRAWWEHSGKGAYPGDWERTAQELSDSGFSAVIPNMLWGGRAHYPSDVLPRSETYARYGDQIQQCIDASHRHGLEVHVWKVCYNLSGAPKPFVDQMRSEQRTQVDSSGVASDWLCPSHPANKKLERDAMLEVVRKYDIDGIHFDYIRYPGSSQCFCDGCRNRFEQNTGQRVVNWPDDCIKGGKLAESYRDWRCDNITELVRTVSEQSRQLKSEVKISAAVFSDYPNCREWVLQDWGLWVRNGYLDFLCPMSYTDDPQRFIELTEKQSRVVDGRIPIYPGIGATATGVHLSADKVAEQIRIARELGMSGFTIFNLDGNTIRDIAPGLGRGILER